MNKRHITALLTFVTAIAIHQTVNAGGMQGVMFNLPPGKAPISSNERIGILVVDVEDNVIVRPLDANGQPFPQAQFSGNLLIVRGSNYSFTLPATTNTERRAVNIQFFRSNAQETVPAQQTQILNNVIVENVAGRVLTMDVVVPRPMDMRKPCSTYVYSRRYVPKCRISSWRCR